MNSKIFVLGGIFAATMLIAMTAVNTLDNTAFADRSRSSGGSDYDVRDNYNRNSDGAIAGSFNNGDDNDVKDSYYQNGGVFN